MAWVGIWKCTRATQVFSFHAKLQLPFRSTISLFARPFIQGSNCMPTRFIERRSVQGPTRSCPSGFAIGGDRRRSPQNERWMKASVFRSEWVGFAEIMRHQALTDRSTDGPTSLCIISDFSLVHSSGTPATEPEDWHSEECKLTPTYSANLYTKIKK